MRLLLITFICGLLPMTLEAQTDRMSNSYKETYDNSFPKLNYSYDSSRQTHNYSRNWDFDSDRKPDSLYFVGNGGAHLYFHLRLILSSEDIVRDFPYLVSDFPMLDSMSHFKKVYEEYQNYPVFVVHDFNNDGKMEIYLNTDTNFAPIPSKWKRRGVTSKSLLISYEKKNIIIKNFPGVK